MHLEFTQYNLDGPDGFNSYCRDLRIEPLLFSKRNFGGGSVMVWGGFSAFKKCNIIHCNNKINSDYFIQILESNVKRLFN